MALWAQLRHGQLQRLGAEAVLQLIVDRARAAAFLAEHRLGEDLS